MARYILEKAYNDVFGEEDCSSKNTVNEGEKKSWAGELEDKDKENKENCQKFNLGRFKVLKTMEEDSVQDVEDSEEEEDDDEESEGEINKQGVGKVYYEKNF